MPNPTTLLWNAQEVADHLRVPRRTIYALVANDSLPAVRLGSRRLRFRPAEVISWIESQSARERRSQADFLDQLLRG